MTKVDKRHRYFVTITRNELYSRDENAIRIELEAAIIENQATDNNCTLVSITRQDHGELTGTVIFGESCELCTRTTDEKQMLCPVCSLAHTSKFKGGNQ